MYTNRAEMKIFAANVVVASAAEAVTVASAASTTAAQQTQQQQREYRCGAQVKLNKYNNKANNMLRQTKYNNNNNNISNNNADNKSVKRQPQQQQSQQQQQQQQQQLHYSNNNNNNNNNMHNNFTRKKYFGNNANNNSYNCNQQQQQQLQQNQTTPSAAKQSNIITNNNNNNNVMKNQNLIEELSCKHSSDNNNNNNNSGSNSSRNDNNNNNTTTNSNISVPKLQQKSNNNNNNNNKKRNSLSSSAESSASFPFYHRCPETTKTPTAISSSSSSSSNNNINNNVNPNDEERQQQQVVTTAAATSATQQQTTAVLSQEEQEQQQQQHDDKLAQRAKQHPMSFWKTSYPQQPTLQQKEYFARLLQQQLEAALAQKETELALAAATAAAAAAAAAAATTISVTAAATPTTTTAAGTTDQHPHYYQYYNAQPKQLTIASFLQKELLPEADKHRQHSQQQHKHQHQQQQQQSGLYQQRYRNSNYNYNGNSSNNNNNNNHGSNSYHHEQQPQQHYNQNHNHNQNHMHFRRNKKPHYYGNNNAGNTCTSATSAQNSIEVVPASNYNGAHRRIPHAAVAGNGNHVAGKMAHYPLHQQNHQQHHQQHHHHHHHHHYHSLMGGNGTPADYQNFYNLTYVNVDAEGSASSGPTATAAATTTTTTATAATVAGINMLLKPGPTVATSAATSTETPTAAAATIAAATAAAGSNQNMFPQQPPSQLPTLQFPMLASNILSPLALTPDAVAITPTNMISCAQLDEAITAAAASSTGNNSGNNINSNSSSSSGSNKKVEHLTVPSPSLGALPFMLHHQQSQQHQQQVQQQHLFPNKSQQQQQQQPQQQPLFFSFNDGYNPAASAAAWSHANSPCYPSVYGPRASSISSGSTQSRIPAHHAVSPASSTCSLASESQWSSRSRSLTSSELLAVSPTPSGTAGPNAVMAGSAAVGQQQLSPHLANMGNGLHTLLPPFGIGPTSATAVPPPPPPPPLPSHGGQHYQHYCGPNCGCNGTNGTWPTPWYELVLPPDRYLEHARNVELTLQPDQLLCHSKYDSLSLDIWKRFCGAQQTHAKFKLKMRLWRYLFIWINQPMFSRYRICLVGSTITGFGTDSSDIDMCLLPEHQTHQHQQHHYNNELRTEALMILNLFNTVLKEMEAFHDFNLIEARVPILRFKDRINGIEVDLNYNNCVGIKNTYLLQLYAQLDWRTRPLVVIVKLWAQYHDINDAKRMTVSSYSLVLMVLHYLQYGCAPHVLPCLQALYPEKFNLGQQDCLDLDLIEPIEPYQTHNTQTLGEHLLGFFKYYSNFDYRNNAISIRTGGILPVNACRLAKSPKNDIHQWKELNIEEPFDLSNTARSVYDNATFERVKAIFVASAHRLEHSLDLSSIFTPIHHKIQRPAMQQSLLPFPTHPNPNHNHSHTHSSHCHVNAHTHAPPIIQHHPIHQSREQLLLHACNSATPTSASKLIKASSYASPAHRV